MAARRKKPLAARRSAPRVPGYDKDRYFDDPEYRRAVQNDPVRNAALAANRAWREQAHLEKKRRHAERHGWWGFH